MTDYVSRDDNDGVPIFYDLEEAMAIAENPDLEREPSGNGLYSERQSGGAARAAMADGYDAETLSELPVLSSGQGDDLHVEEQHRRIWLSRTGVADGEPFENTVSVEWLINGSWVVVAKYDGGDLGEDVEEDRRLSQLGKFVVEIEPGNAAMQTGGHVAEALRKLAGKLDFTDWDGDGPIIDENGNTVGRYTFHDNN